MPGGGIGIAFKYFLLINKSTVFYFTPYHGSSTLFFAINHFGL